MAIALQQEYDFFLAHLDEFMKTHLDKLVLIKGEQVIGFFDSYEEALRAGLAQYGSQTPFFIKEVQKEKVIHYFHGIK